MSEFIFSGKVPYLRMPTALIPPAGFPLTAVILAFLVVPLRLVGTAFMVMVAVVSVIDPNNEDYDVNPNIG